jgi:hypothetical protein
MWTHRTSKTAGSIEMPKAGFRQDAEHEVASLSH